MRIKSFIAKSLTFFVLLVIVGSAWAVDLQQAKADGLVGEQLNGYLGIVDTNAGSDVRALVDNINAKRKAKYESIARKNATSLENVEFLAGQKAVEKTESGNYVQTASGWKKK